MNLYRNIQIGSLHLMRHLSIGDADVLNIVHYMNGLRPIIYSKLIEHRSDMRNLPFAGAMAAAPNPFWDFVSFDYVSSKASSFENELTAAARDQARVKHTSAVAAHDNNTRTIHNINVKRLLELNVVITSPRKRIQVRSDVHCKWHPDSQSHSTKDCRNPGTTAARLVLVLLLCHHMLAVARNKDDLSQDTMLWL